MNKKDPASCASEMASACVATRARLIGRALSAVYDDAIREFGVKISQVNLLVIVYKLGDAKSADVCRIMKMDASTLSRNVDRMKKKGWLDSRHDDGDRSMIVTVTPAGGELLTQIHAKWKEAQRKAVDMLDVDGVESIFKISARLWTMK
jgi:DNA-binding MarR family transcriptional regulator